MDLLSAVIRVADVWRLRLRILASLKSRQKVARQLDILDQQLSDIYNM